MALSGSVFVCLFGRLHRQCSADIGVGFMCHLLDVTILPVLVMHILYDLSWWLWLSLFSIVPWVHNPPSSHWTATVDPIGRETRFLEVSMPCSLLYCLFTNAVWCFSSLLVLISSLSIIDIIPLTGQLNSNVAGLGGLAPVALILFVTELCICHSQSQNTPSWFILWIRGKPPPVHCSGGDMMLILFALYLDYYRNFWAFLK